MNFELLVATNNAHKLKEIRQILSPFHITVYGMKDLNIDIGEVEENGSTYYENALIKANALKKVTTMPIIADDSGIEIEALDYGPGIYTARYAASHGGHLKTNEYLVDFVKDKSRNARFICDIVLVNVEERPLKFEAIIDGEIADKLTGEEGFGYDPIFVEKSTGKTYASMSKEEKNRVSHRGLALRKLLTYLKINGFAH